MVRHAGKVILLVAAVAGGTSLLGRAHDRDAPLHVTGLVLAGSRAISPHLVEETYRAEVTHAGRPADRDFAGVTARLVPPYVLEHPGILQVLDGEVEFGSVRTGQTVESRDTIMIRRHVRVPLKPQRLRWTIVGRPDLVLSEAWAGQWRFTITSRDPESNRIAAVDEITSSLGAGEPLGFSLLPEPVQCRWSGSDGRLQADCRAHFRFPGCTGDGSAQFTLERIASSAVGHANWRVVADGDCGPNAGTGGESIEIAGVRLSADADPEPFSPGALIRFVTTPAMARLIAEGPDDAIDPPRDEDDCRRGRWRRWKNPAFHDARVCMDFAGRHRGGEKAGR